MRGKLIRYPLVKVKTKIGKQRVRACNQCGALQAMFIHAAAVAATAADKRSSRVCNKRPPNWLSMKSAPTRSRACVLYNRTGRTWMGSVRCYLNRLCLCELHCLIFLWFSRQFFFPYRYYEKFLGKSFEIFQALSSKTHYRGISSNLCSRSIHFTGGQVISKFSLNLPSKILLKWKSIRLCLKYSRISV